MQKRRKLLQGWSNLEIALLGVIVILCVCIGAVLLFAVGASVVERAAAATPTPGASTSAQGDGPTDVGPLVGDQSVFVDEVQCQLQAIQDPANNLTNYWPATGAPEHTDSIHSGVVPCATFTGKHVSATRWSPPLATMSRLVMSLKTTRQPSSVKNAFQRG